MSKPEIAPGLRWDTATAIYPMNDSRAPYPQGLLVPDTTEKCDRVAVVFDKGQAPPEITIKEISGSVHTVLADGIAVAVVARAAGPAPSAEDVLLVERYV
ncbi:hypothetical protein [Sulfitobacter sp. JB4-11]|uniref:hypothetical protein n=1 Tax=Sulfitobacter rhodophyticola TaxID=3238304 RepID=UPI003519BB76